MQDERRIRLIERVRALPAAQLCHIERVVRQLESGELPPHSTDCAFARAPVKPGDFQGAGGGADGTALAQTKDWPHAPLHRLSQHGTYIVTGGTLHKDHHFRGPVRLELLESALLSVMKECRWRLEAWAVFSNHYHFVAHAEPEAISLEAVIKRLHGRTAIELNELDGTHERPVWHNYWDTRLTFEKSYLARLNYVHQNAVRHGLVPVASQYRWCSAAWFEHNATRARVRTVYSFRTDKLKVHDDFEPI